MGAQTWPPNPHTFAAPRRSRGAALEWVMSAGPRLGPHTPPRSQRPGPAGGAALEWFMSAGPRLGPHTHTRSQRPGAAVALLWNGSRHVGRAATWPRYRRLFGPPRRS